MALRRALLLLVATTLLQAGRCGPSSSCPPVSVPEDMNELRARELDPSVTTGIALSTTLVTGDCRSDRPQAATDDCGRIIDHFCIRERSPLLVLAIPINTSVPTSLDCDGAYLVDELRRSVVLEEHASELGELVHALPTGRYTLYVSSDDRCALCGLAEAQVDCVIEVPEGNVAVRDLVLDRSTR